MVHLEVFAASRALVRVFLEKSGLFGVVQVDFVDVGGQPFAGEFSLFGEEPFSFFVFEDEGTPGVFALVGGFLEFGGAHDGFPVFLGWNEDAAHLFEVANVADFHCSEM